MGLSNQGLLIAAPAKLNLFLELLGKRGDGFHELETIMCKIALYDYLRFSATVDDQITIDVQIHPRLGNVRIPTDQTNLACKALRVMLSLAGKQAGANIRLYKNIPIEAGLGGASANAAAALIAGNLIWELGWSKTRLMQIAEQIGSDVAFFLGGDFSRCTGRGGQVHNLNYPRRLNVVLVKPSHGFSTKAIYARCEVPKQPITSDTILSGLQSGSASKIGGALFNRLAQFAEYEHDDILKLRSEFDKTNSVGHQLTGSGSCYFGIYNSAKAMKTAAKKLVSRLPEMQVFTSHSLNSRRYSSVN